jgi:hypothetical protein
LSGIKKIPGYFGAQVASGKKSRHLAGLLAVKSGNVILPMKTKIIAVFLFGAAFLTEGALAQTATLTSMPTTPAPVVVTAATPAPSQVIYSPRLPSPAELTNAAAAQGITVQKIDQTSSQITVVYQYANGQTTTVAYQLLPAAGTTPTQTYVESAPPPTVVYAPPPQVVYYESYGPRYYPAFWYPPVSLRLGFGYGFRGGFGFRGVGRWR